jgi:beta-phosphoglucomutase-like phosphatase (HAD superfamily)
LPVHKRDPAPLIAVATTTNRPNVDALCDACCGKPVTDIFNVIAAGDEVAAMKPAPDVFLLALKRLV